MSRVGIIESVDNVKKVIHVVGFGEFVGNRMVEDPIIGVEIEVPVVTLDNGEEFVNTNGYYWADESCVKNDIESYIGNGYEVNF